MDLNVLINLIGSVGFPIVICLYLLSNFGKKIDRLCNLLEEVLKNNERV